MAMDEDREAATPQVVVGAGPSGLAAAVTFGATGRAVRVLERHDTVGHRYGDGLQGLENWSARDDVLQRLHRIGLRTDFAYRPFREVTFYDSRLRPVIARSPRPLFYLVRRGPGADSFDGALLRQAHDLGVEVRTGTVARSAAPGTVVATGPRAPDGLVVGFTFRSGLPDQAHVLVHPGLAPAGYAYLLIWDGLATLATFLFRDRGRWRQARDSTVAAFESVVPGLQPRDPRPFAGVGSLTAATRFRDGGGRLYAGEASGLQDPEWGFGMLTAVRSGVLAASSLLGGWDYGEQARRQLVPARDAGLVNRTIFERLPDRIVDPLLRIEVARPDLPGRLHRHWAPAWWKSLAASRLTGPARQAHADRACHRGSCECLDCRCAAHPACSVQ